MHFFLQLGNLRSLENLEYVLMEIAMAKFSRTKWQWYGITCCETKIKANAKLMTLRITVTYTVQKFGKKNMLRKKLRDECVVLCIIFLSVLFKQFSWVYCHS